MSARRDYYQVLGAPRDADAKALKKAFRQLARRYHPDTSPSQTRSSGSGRSPRPMGCYPTRPGGPATTPRGSPAWPGSARKTCGAASTSPASSGLACPGSAACSSGCSGGRRRACREGRRQVIDQPCPACHGTGQATGQDTVTVRIPRGIPDGTALRLAGRGMPSPVPGGPPGDAYVIIRMLPDPQFVREGADLWHPAHRHTRGRARHHGDGARA